MTTTNENRIALKTIEGLSILDTSEIVYFQADGRYSQVFKLNTPNAVRVYHSISDIERILPSCFFRCHRSYLVNTDHILKVKGKIKRLQMRNQTEIPLSDDKVKLILQTMFKSA